MNALTEGIIGSGRLETIVISFRDDGGLNKNGSSRDEKR